MRNGEQSIRMSFFPIVSVQVTYLCLPLNLSHHFNLKVRDKNLLLGIHCYLMVVSNDSETSFLPGLLSILKTRILGGINCSRCTERCSPREGVVTTGVVMQPLGKPG